MPLHNSGHQLLSARISTWRRREKSAAVEQVSSDQRSEFVKPDLMGFEPKALMEFLDEFCELRSLSWFKWASISAARLSPVQREAFLDAF